MDLLTGLVSTYGVEEGTRRGAALINYHNVSKGGCPREGVPRGMSQGGRVL